MSFLHLSLGYCIAKDDGSINTLNTAFDEDFPKVQRTDRTHASLGIDRLLYGSADNRYLNDFHVCQA